jgi:hypothetical protein
MKQKILSSIYNGKNNSAGLQVANWDQFSLNILEKSNYVCGLFWFKKGEEKC